MRKKIRELIDAKRADADSQRANLTSRKNTSIEHALSCLRDYTSPGCDYYSQSGLQMLSDLLEQKGFNVSLAQFVDKQNGNSQLEAVGEANSLMMLVRQLHKTARDASLRLSDEGKLEYPANSGALALVREGNTSFCKDWDELAAITEVDGNHAGAGGCRRIFNAHRAVADMVLSAGRHEMQMDEIGRHYVKRTRSEKAGNSAGR